MLLTANNAITVVIAWLMISTLYPVLISSPSSSTIAKQQDVLRATKTISKTPTTTTERVVTVVEVDDDRNYEAALIEINRLRKMVQEMREQVQHVSQSIPKPEDVVINVPTPECPVVEAVESVEQPQCPPPPEYVLDEVTKTTLTEIINRQDQYRQLYQDMKDSFDHLITKLNNEPAPTCDCECESIEESRQEILQQVEQAMSKNQETTIRMNALQSQISSKSEERQSMIDSMKNELQRIESLSQELDSKIGSVKDTVESSTSSFYQHVTSFEDALVREKAKNEVLVNKVNELLQQPKPTCPVVEAVSVPAPAPACLQPNSSMIEEAFHNALGQHIEILKRGMELEASREKGSNRQPSDQKLIAKKQQEETDQKNDIEQKARVDYALAISGTKVVYELTSPTFMPDNFEPMQVLESTLKMVGLSNSEQVSQSILDTFHIDYGVGNPLEALDKSIEPGRCWGMKVSG